MNNVNQSENGKLYARGNTGLNHPICLAHHAQFVLTWDILRKNLALVAPPGETFVSKLNKQLTICTVISPSQMRCGTRSI